MSFKVVITGASGLLGRAIYKTLSEINGLAVLGLCNTRCSNSNYQKCDLTDPNAVNDCFKTFQPNLIIHCAAERRPDVIEKQPELAESINISATRTIAQLADELNACLLFISTDYVMDGKSPPYCEDSTTNPLNAYGLSKLEGEKIVVSSYDSENMVVRVPLLYGSVEFLSESAVTILFSKVQDSSQSCNMSHYERRYPTHCGDVALFIAKIIKNKFLTPSACSADIKGVLHFSGHEEMTKYDMSVIMADIFHLKKEHILTDTNCSGGAARPYNAHLVSNKVEKLGLTIQTRSFKDGIQECLKPWLNA